MISRSGSQGGCKRKNRCSSGPATQVKAEDEWEADDGEDGWPGRRRVELDRVVEAFPQCTLHGRNRFRQVVGGWTRERAVHGYLSTCLALLAGSYVAGTIRPIANGRAMNTPSMPGILSSKQARVRPEMSDMEELERRRAYGRLVFFLSHLLSWLLFSSGPISSGPSKKLFSFWKQSPGNPYFQVNTTPYWKVARHQCHGPWATVS